MSMNLWKRHFGDIEDEIEAEESQRKARIERLSQLFMTEGYRLDIRDWLRNALAECEPRPGSEQAMLLAIGIRDGLRMVEAHLSGLEREVAEENRNV